MSSVKQCRSCPWRVDCVPDRDIPRYRRDLHENLRGTIRSGIDSLSSTMRIMACHYSKPDEEFACAGWLANQLSVGNNIAVRIAILRKRLAMPELDGPQHERFEDTLDDTREESK